jgi:hypothetical protein
LLYQLCTGSLPFDADTPYAVILKHITAPLPSPRSLRPDLPEPVEQVLLKALAKDPHDRYQTAGELRRALRAAIASPHVSLPSSRLRLGLRSWVVAAFTCLLGLLLLARSWAPPYLIARPALTPASAGGSATLLLQGPGLVEDTWLDPDVPDEAWHEADLVHLQGPLTPDRLLLRFDLSALPAGATVVSATLALRTELWGGQSFPGAAVAYRLLTAWEPRSATYNRPWSAPGLVAGIDYDPTPLDLSPVPDAGWLVLDVGRALAAWREEDKPDYGIVVMMSEDSHNQAHHWVYMTEQRDPADQPALYVTYQAAP